MDPQFLVRDAKPEVEGISRLEKMMSLVSLS
jgi:hypothetical protein